MIDNLILVRHGQSTANAQRIFGGYGNYPLTKEGVAQAKFISNFLSNVELSKIYSSPVKRAFDTAQIIAEHHDVDVTVRKGLIERNVGKASGKPITTVKHIGTLINYPEYDETFSNLQRRVMKEINHIKKSSSGNVVVVTHADPIISVLYHYQNIKTNRKSKSTLKLDTGGMSVISFKFPEPMIVLFNYSKKINNDLLKS